MPNMEWSNSSNKSVWNRFKFLQILKAAKDIAPQSKLKQNTSIGETMRPYEHLLDLTYSKGCHSRVPHQACILWVFWIWNSHLEDCWTVPDTEYRNGIYSRRLLLPLLWGSWLGPRLTVPYNGTSAEWHTLSWDDRNLVHQFPCTRLALRGREFKNPNRQIVRSWQSWDIHQS